MFKMILNKCKCKKGKDKEDKINLYLRQLDENNIYYPGAESGAMRCFLEEAIKKGFIEIRAVE